MYLLAVVPCALVSGADLVVVRVACDHLAIAPGATILIGVTYSIEPKWHIYWRNAGDTGVPTELKVKAPKGFTVGLVQWPRPKVFTEQGDVSFGYERTVTLLVPVTAPPLMERDLVTVEVSTAWLVCKGVCRFGEAKTSIVLPVSEAKARPGEPFATFLKRIPKPLASLKGAKASVVGSMLRIEGPSGAFKRIEFLPDHTPGVRYEGSLPHRGTVRAGRFVIEIPLEITLDDALGKDLRAAGILVLGSRDTDPAYDVSMPIPSDVRP
jgi:hypothetical protein